MHDYVVSSEFLFRMSLVCIVIILNHLTALTSFTVTIRQTSLPHLRMISGYGEEV